MLAKELFLTDISAGSSQQTRDIRRTLLQCWANVCGAGPTLKQHWVNISCLLVTDGSDGNDYLTLHIINKYSVKY